MANPGAKLAANVEGDFFVDASCIDCGTCRWMAPGVFDRDGEHSRVHAQPDGEADTRAALMALLACPTGSIGSLARHPLKALLNAFPRPIDGPVHHCGFHAESSFGAAAWVIQRPDGNVMVDCPRFTIPLVRRIEAMGGVATMVLTHKDDVADHRLFARHFGCTRVLHADDVDGHTDDVETRITGRAPTRLADDLLLIPVPGHTRGSMCVLHGGRHLFSGDHLAWDIGAGRLTAFRDACWYDWGELAASMRRLADHTFEWVLPGHGAPCHLPAPRMAAAIRDLLGWLDRG